MPNLMNTFHPSIVLGNVVDNEIMVVLKEIENANHKIDAAKDKMNSLIIMKRSISITMNELLALNVNVTSLEEKIKDLEIKITEAATTYISTKIEKELIIHEQNEKLSTMESKQSMEGPIDYKTGEIIYKPFFIDSLKMDAQYFNFRGDDKNEKVYSEIGKKLDNNKINSEIKKDIIDKADNNLTNISGILMITANCTHKMVGIIEPFVINPNKAIAIWNRNFPEDTIAITNNKQSIASHKETSNDNKLDIASGAVYGSSIVGMVHFLKSNTNLKNIPNELISSIKDKIKLNQWLNRLTGGFGISDSVIEDVRKTLNIEEINSHISLFTSGVIPKLSSTSNKKNNKILNIDALITAFDNYINHINTMDKDSPIGGVPLKYYIKSITKNDILKVLYKDVIRIEDNEESKKSSSS